MTDQRKVVIATEDRLFGETVQRYLARTPGWTVTGVAFDGVHALSRVNDTRPASVLVLGDLPRIGPAALARQVRRRWPETTVVILGEATTEDALVLPAESGVDDVLRALGSSPPSWAGYPTGDGPDSVALLASLTPRERLVLKLLAEGLRVEEVAAELGVSRHTVRTHTQNVYAKLALHSRLDVVRFAARHGLLGLEPDGQASQSAEPL